MREQLFHLDRNRPETLQSQLREQLVAAILDGHIPVGEALPSCRRLAKKLGVARNTVVLAYQQLADQGYLTVRQRSGYYVEEAILTGRVNKTAKPQLAAAIDSLDWQRRFRVCPSEQRNIIKVADWYRYPYPFVCGQSDPTLFPTADWRECVRRALSVQAIHEWSRDQVDRDDPLLLEQIHTRLLPRRGVWARPEQILLTNGAQQALYLLASLLISKHNRVGIEEPGYADVRNIFALKSNNMRALALDEQGLIVDHNINLCDYVYVTPSHQSPTTVTMSLQRRHALLERAASSDVIIFEDDYESETNFIGEPTPALKSLDKDGRVIYIASISKTLAPGLRMGYLVAPTELIHEARALRRLMMRHPPTNNQRAVAMFLALGHHDALVKRLRQAYRQRWQVMRDALEHYLPESSQASTFGGTSFWVCGPPTLDAGKLRQKAAEQGVLIEPGDVEFMRDSPPLNYFRLGYSSIVADRIEPGIRKLAQLIPSCCG